MKYVKKPVVVEAFQFEIDETPEWFKSEYGKQVDFHGGTPTRCEIKTLEGIMIGNKGDMIIKGIQGEIYSCKKDIFEATYEPFEDTIYYRVSVENDS